MLYKLTCAKTEKPKLKRIIIQCVKEHNRTKLKILCTSDMDFLIVAKDDANLVSLFSSFHNFPPRYENAFWPVLVFSRGICKFVSVERRM